MPSMKSVAEIHLDNLEALVSEAGTADSLAEASKLSPVYISQIRSRAVDLKTGKPRDLGSQTARRLESGMNKPAGWMDQDHSGGTGTQEWPFFSISPDRFVKLPDHRKGLIEDRVLTIIDEREAAEADVDAK